MQSATGVVIEVDIVSVVEASAVSVVVDDCAGRAVTAAHQAHGAIGMTRESPLQQVTRRVHALRSAWTPTAVTAERLGRLSFAAPSFSRLVASHPDEPVALS